MIQQFARFAALAAALFAAGAVQAQTVKIAYIDPLSGPFANVGEQGLAEFRFATDRINKSGILGKVKLEVALGRGKDKGDKRRTIADRDAKRQMERALKTRR